MDRPGSRRLHSTSNADIECLAWWMLPPETADTAGTSHQGVRPAPPGTGTMWHAGNSSGGATMVIGESRLTADGAAARCWLRRRVPTVVGDRPPGKDGDADDQHRAQ